MLQTVVEPVDPISATQQHWNAPIAFVCWFSIFVWTLAPAIDIHLCLEMFLLRRAKLQNSWGFDVPHQRYRPGLGSNESSFAIFEVDQKCCVQRIAKLKISTSFTFHNKIIDYTGFTVFQTRLENYAPKWLENSSAKNLWVRSLMEHPPWLTDNLEMNSAFNIWVCFEKCALKPYVFPTKTIKLYQNLSNCWDDLV